MKCEEARFLFPGKVDERLTAEELSNLEAHLTVCPVCPREWERFLQSVPRLRSAPKSEASPGSTQPVIVTATLEPSYPRRLQILFFPLHVKLPLMAVAIILVWTLVGLLSRQGPELRRAPETPVAPRLQRYRLQISQSLGHRLRLKTEISQRNVKISQRLSRADEEKPVNPALRRRQQLGPRPRSPPSSDRRPARPSIANSRTLCARPVELWWSIPAA
jgi:hypothetical protein